MTYKITLLYTRLVCLWEKNSLTTVRLFEIANTTYQALAEHCALSESITIYTRSVLYSIGLFNFRKRAHRKENKRNLAISLIF